MLHFGMEKPSCPGPALQCGRPPLEVLGLGIPGKLFPTQALEDPGTHLCLAPEDPYVWLSTGEAHFTDQLG